MQSVLGPGHVVAGRYRLLDQLGRGAMGIVWRSRDEVLDREVAVKQIVLPPMASETEAQASYRRTLREARTAARLSHPAVVTVFDVLEEEGTPWIVMELIRARPLDHVIAEDGPLPPAEAARLGRELLDALATAHAAGVLHRDVKPSNVLVRQDGKAVLTDFGVATIQGDPGLTQAGMVVGTPGFAPPERVRGEPATPASDLWSLGATLYAAVEGRGPFDRAGGSAAIVASVATEPAPRAPSAGPLAPVIEALLRADPAQRPDAATTSRMLIDADSAVRSPLAAASMPAGSASAGSYPPGALAAGTPTMDATTATQVVSVPGAFEPAGGQPGDQPAGGQLAGGRQPGGQAGEEADGPASTRSGSAAAAAGRAAAGRAAAGRAAAGASAPVNQAEAGALTDRAGHEPATPGPGSDPGVIPDLMATPVFAELKMPVSPASPELPQRTSALGQPNPLGRRGTPPAGQSPTTEAGADGASAAVPVRSKRGLMLLAAAAAVIIVIGGVWVAFPGLTASLAQNFDQPSSITGGTAGSGARPTAPNSHHAAKGHGRAPGSGATGSPGPSAGHTPSGKHTQSGGPSPSRNPTPSGRPSPSATPSPSPTPSPTGTGSGGSTPPPPGYAWRSVSAASIGTTAGFRLAAPARWLMTPGLVSIIKPPKGSMRLKINLTPFAVQGPVREARYLQAVAIATHRYPHYHLLSILAITFHGRPAATWQFWWRPNISLVRVIITEVIFTAGARAGHQPYVLAMSAPATRAGWASGIFRVAMRTFMPLPGAAPAS